MVGLGRVGYEQHKEIGAGDGLAQVLPRAHFVEVFDRTSTRDAHYLQAQGFAARSQRLADRADPDDDEGLAREQPLPPALPAFLAGSRATTPS
jgi:hypothetical protein